jgi:hypothetical protein
MSGEWGYGTVFQVFLWSYLLGGLTLLPAIAVLGWFSATTKVGNGINAPPQVGDTADLYTARTKAARVWV